MTLCLAESLFPSSAPPSLLPVGWPSTALMEGVRTPQDQYSQHVTASTGMGGQALEVFRQKLQESLGEMQAAPVQGPW